MNRRAAGKVLCRVLWTKWKVGKNVDVLRLIISAACIKHEGWRPDKIDQGDAHSAKLKYCLKSLQTERCTFPRLQST